MTKNSAERASRSSALGRESCCCYFGCQSTACGDHLVACEAAKLNVVEGV